MRLDGHVLHWNNFGLGLQEETQVHLSMPNYVKKALEQFQHIAGTLQQSPYPSVPIQYGAKKQYATAESTAPLLDARSKRFIQQFCGKFVFLGQAV
jgi:hypothetical protein